MRLAKIRGEVRFARLVRQPSDKDLSLSQNHLPACGAQACGSPLAAPETVAVPRDIRASESRGTAGLASTSSHQ